MADLSALDAHIERVRGLGSLARQAAPVVAEAVEAELERQIKAATDPSGKAWAERQEGGKALATADKALVVVPIGTRVFARLKGHIARHNNGTAKGGLVRQILPTSGLPARLAQVVKGAVEQTFERVMGGDRG